MATPFASARHQAMLSTATGYRRWSRFTFSRSGTTRVLEPASGRLTQDARRNGRWDGTLTFTDSDVIPRTPRDLLTPFGTRVEVELGIEMLDGTVSSVPFGTFEISGCDPRQDADNQSVSITLTDLSNRVERYRFESPFTVVSGTDLGTMINRVVTNRTGISPGVTTVGATLGANRVFGLDPATAPWSEIIDVLNGFNRTAWYDRVGHIVVGVPTADPTTAYPIAGTLSLAPDFVTFPPNVVVVRGEPDDLPPVQAVAMDTDPSSPTYAGASPGASPYGRVTEYFSSPLLTTVSAAQAAANTILAANVGAGATYEWTRPYDPTIDAMDVISHGGSTVAVDLVTVDLTGPTTLLVRELT